VAQELAGTAVSEPLCQIVLADLRVAVVTSDADLQILTHVPGLGELLQETRDALTGESLLHLFPELFGCEEELASVAHGRLPRFDLPMINRLDPNNMDRRYISLTALPHPEIRGHLVWFVQDVTSQGFLEQKLTQKLNEVRLLRGRLEATNKELTRLNDEKSAFLRMAAHDLRAPLAVIQGYVEMIMEDIKAAPGEDALALLDVVLRRTRQMSDLIDNLLDVERIESGAVTLELRPVDLQALVDEVGQGLEPVARQKDLALHWQVPTGCPQPRGDRARLAQVLNNLMSNALKFTAAGGRVGINVHVRQEELAVEVSDTGPGISEEDQARLFRRFFRTDSARQQHIPGTGLGLSIAKAIVEQHGGQVYCRSNLGRGSTFGFTLPVVEV
jgi:signal transduction histidine kinase